MSGAPRRLGGAGLRRIVQVAALLLFFGLLLAARRRGEGEPGLYLQFFFLTDPLLLILNWLSAHAAPAALWFALGTVLLTAVLGRVFCGWFCPLGTLNALAGRLLDLCLRRPKRAEHWSPWQLAKYYLLGAILLMAACGVHAGAILDPIVLLYRSAATYLLPGGQWIVEEGTARLGLAEVGRSLVRNHLTEVERQAFFGGGLIGLILLAILLLNGYRHRFWCRYVCPLGALLGVFALRPLLQRRLDRATCNECDLCGVDCHGAAASGPGDAWKSAECFGCLNCTPACREQSLRFQWVLPWRKEPPATPGTSSSSPAPPTTHHPPPAPRRSRRQFMRNVARAAGTAIGASAAMTVFRAAPQARGAVGDERLVRPPGALPERDFLARCTACGICMKICPTGCLQPAFDEAGLEGLWTPLVNPRIGRCEYDCTLCGHVCPTGAIAPLTREAKHLVKIGVAVLDRSRCIPFAYGRDCGTCVEACPFPDKAIRLVDVEVMVHDGRQQVARVVSQPVVDPDLCTGCGGCVKECTFKDEPAIHVVSANESRHPATRPFLDLGRPTAARPAATEAPAADDPYGK